MNAGWLQKPPKRRITPNIKLRQAIIDALPFDMDKDLADKILCVILDTIVKGVKRDGFVTINHLGRFYAHAFPARYMAHNILKNSKSFYAGRKYIQARKHVGFKVNKVIRKSLDEPSED